ncbi:LPO_1073/Vpar_1526 family protein [Klebsiella pneumoniae]|uniref:LPO_1073/Vpar_1526 family protein n=1 Tax=Klebsiella pneumoniae TaxID=573 RepID=UPI000E2A6804|nr:LPO_1073/Vpar_1526 family protein [Klebsiella pneumoniae]RLL03752.1 hypothetical protein D9K82_04550 [Klebsiella pneumoniae]SWS01342.1 Uncharacterised protein [Klebsiella pneumoniae]
MSKLFGDKQSQTTSEGSVAIQAGGNVNYSGLSYGEVKEICTDLMKANFPILREDARQLSKEYVEDFGKKLFDKMVQENLGKTEEKLKNPDVQAAINSSVLHVARMTNKSHQDILCELLVEKINEGGDDDNLLINEAIEVTSKISINQIRFITFIHLLRNAYPTKKIDGKIVKDDDKNSQFNYLENTIANVIGDEIYPVDVNFLTSKGLCVSYTGSFKYQNSFPVIMKERTGRNISTFMTEKDITAGDELSSNFPRLMNVITKFGFNHVVLLDACLITRLSEIIASAYLRTKGVLK